MGAAFRWGILGTGSAARKFVLGLRAADGARAVVVASRSPQRAGEFAAALGIARACGGYEEAAHDADVDALYVATPPSLHHEHALLCLNAGKPVLVEKPFAVDAAQARAIAETARARGLFCMEAMWTRFLPAVRRVKALLDEGAAGDVRMISGTFGTADAVHPASPLYSQALGGGALLDRGVYLISLAFHLVGAPAAITADAIIGSTGVDEEVAAVLRYAAGCLGLFGASLRTRCPNELVIMGTRAQIRLHTPIYRPFRLTITPVRERAYTPATGPAQGGAWKESHWVHQAFQRFSGAGSKLLSRGVRHETSRYAGNGYHYEAEELMRCVRAGKLESAIMPLSESVGIMEAVDTIRSHWQARAGRPDQRGDQS